MSASDNLSFIQECVRAGHLLWTYHANMRLTQRSINRQAVLASVENYQVKNIRGTPPLVICLPV